MNKNPDQTNDIIFIERISSNRTMLLFLVLMFLFFFLFVWRMTAVSLDVLAVAFLFLSIFFLFYVINYRSLVIHITHQYLRLKFGIFTWTEQLRNIAGCALDELPMFMRMGGAGIHFMLIRKRYCASFNFLEYPRVVIALKRKRGLVQDVSFSTRQSEKILKLLGDEITPYKSVLI
jgi:Ca2+/Na+ antiporter